MPDRQYTFRTTKATGWIENILDSMPSNQRSSFIREAIIEKIEGREVGEITTIITSPPPPPVESNIISDNIISEGITSDNIISEGITSEVEEEDIKYKLKNMFKFDEE